MKHCIGVETDYTDLNKRTSKEQLDGKGGQRSYYHRQRCMHQYVEASVLRSALKNFGCEGQQGRAVAQVGEDRKCLTTEVNTIKCVNSLYQHFSSHWAQKVS